MQVEREDYPQYSILRFEGPILIGESSGKFYEILNSMMEEGIQVVLLDFTHVNYIDSTGIGELVGFLDRFQKEKGRIALINPQDRVMQLLKIAGLDHVFTIYPDIESALQGMNLD